MLKGGERVCGKVCASLVTCIILCQTGSEIYSAVSLCDMNCQLVNLQLAGFFWWTYRYYLQGEADEALGESQV